jgi:CMP-N-acetylneuraminic acid synthetase
VPIAIVPIKRNSTRLPNKNFLDLNGKALLSYIFETLQRTTLFEEIYCYTSDPTISNLLPDGVKILDRDPQLDLDSATHEELWIPAIEAMPKNSKILMTHATSPLLSMTSIRKSYEVFNEGNYDSVFGVQELKNHIWFAGKPLNYELGNLIPTQNISPVLKETNGIYFFRREGFLRSKSRIHGKSMHFILSDIESLDIDNWLDFKVAEVLIKSEEGTSW